MAEPGRRVFVQSVANLHCGFRNPANELVKLLKGTKDISLLSTAMIKIVSIRGYSGAYPASVPATGLVLLQQKEYAGDQLLKYLDPWKGWTVKA